MHISTGRAKIIEVICLVIIGVMYGTGKKISLTSVGGLMSPSILTTTVRTLDWAVITVMVYAPFTSLFMSLIHPSLPWLLHLWTLIKSPMAGSSIVFIQGWGWVIDALEGSWKTQIDWTWSSVTIYYVIWTNCSIKSDGGNSHFCCYWGPLYSTLDPSWISQPPHPDSADRALIMHSLGSLVRCAERYPCSPSLIVSKPSWPHQREPSPLK